jgi:DNA-binding NarL/FixJ family response regulator
MNQTGEAMERIKLVVADDQALVLEALLLLSEGSFEVLGKASDGKALLELSKQVTPDIYLIDVNMPGMDGFEAGRKLLEHNPTARMLFISGDCSARLVRESEHAGGLGFISKNASAEEFATAIETVARGESFLDKAARATLENQGDSGLNSLTPRQISVLQLIAEGLTAKEIASRLGLSPRTAEFHRQCIMERLNLHSTAELTRFAIGEGLVHAGLDPNNRSIATHPSA